MIRAFFSSPYSSYAGSRRDAVVQAQRAVLNLDGLFPVLALSDVMQCDVDCVWSPLIEGDIIRAARAGTSNPFTEDEAQKWCVEAMARGGFNTLITSRTIPRRSALERSFCDEEFRRATACGWRVVTDVDVQMGVLSEK